MTCAGPPLGTPPGEGVLLSLQALVSPLWEPVTLGSRPTGTALPGAMQCLHFPREPQGPPGQADTMSLNLTAAIFDWCAARICILFLSEFVGPTLVNKII